MTSSPDGNSCHLERRLSVYQLVLDAQTKRGSAQAQLRIELPAKDAHEIRWAPGALDSILGFRDESLRQTTARTLVAAINNALRRPSAKTDAHLYELLRESDTISVIDETLSRVVEASPDRQSLAALARRLICDSPDLEPVKAGVALLGASGDLRDAELISAIGRYEEITLFSVVALTNLLPEPEQAIWHLAKEVHGWGRIHAVRHLAETKNPEIRAWLLRDGFRNFVMYEYLAYTCATAGGLAEALSAAEVDENLLIAAGEILKALIAGGPAEDIEDYAHSPAVCVAFLDHMAKKPARDVLAMDAVCAIRSLAEGERAEALRRLPNWSAQVLFDIRTLASSVLQSSEARETIGEGLTSSNLITFNIAADLAPNFGIDAWPLRLERQRAQQSEQWYWLMQTRDSSRVELVLALAREQLNLESIASGPTSSLGLSPEFKDDDALNFILQDLKRFPGVGWDLIRIGLQGRVLRTRNMAINALHEWGREAWPPDAIEALLFATQREPDPEVRDRLRQLVNGG